MSSPLEVVEKLAPAYREWKAGEKEKEKQKKLFFTAAEDDIKENGEPAEELVVVVGCASDAQAIEKAEMEYPGWLVAAVRPYEDDEENPAHELLGPGVGAWECIIEEDPKYMEYSVEFDGYMWKKQVAEGSQMLDDEKLAKEDPELYKRVTQFPNWTLLSDLAYEAGMDPREADREFAMTHEGVEYTGFDGYLEWQCVRHGLKRVLRDADEIADKDLGSLQAYTYLGKPTVKLAAPTKIKE